MFRVIYPDRWLVWAIVAEIAASIIVLWQIQLYSAEQDAVVLEYISIATGTHKSGVDASIHSTSSGQAPLSTDTSGWKTYRNEKYGFEFQYPSKNFEINEYDNYATLTDSLTKYEKRPFEIQFSRGVLSQGVYSKISNLKDLIQSYRSSPERFGVKEINIAGFSGVESNFIYDHTEINFIINNYIYSIVWTPSDYEIWRSVIRAFTPINL